MFTATKAAFRNCLEQLLYGRCDDPSNQSVDNEDPTIGPKIPVFLGGGAGPCKRTKNEIDAQRARVQKAAHDEAGSTFVAYPCGVGVGGGL